MGVCAQSAPGERCCSARRNALQLQQESLKEGNCRRSRWPSASFAWLATQSCPVTLDTQYRRRRKQLKDSAAAVVAVKRQVVRPTAQIWLPPRQTSKPRTSTKIRAASCFGSNTKADTRPSGPLVLDFPRVRSRCWGCIVASLHAGGVLPSIRRDRRVVVDELLRAGGGARLAFVVCVALAKVVIGHYAWRRRALFRCCCSAWRIAIAYHQEMALLLSALHAPLVVVVAIGHGFTRTRGPGERPSRALRAPAPAASAAAAGCYSSASRRPASASSPRSASASSTSGRGRRC